MKTKHFAQLEHRVASTRRISVAAFSNLSALIGLAAFFVALVLASMTAAKPETSMRVSIRNLDGGVYPTAPVLTPAETPCASAGTWTEQAPYPIAIWGHAVASVGENFYRRVDRLKHSHIKNVHRQI